jgi:hypothetical protein
MASLAISVASSIVSPWVATLGSSGTKDAEATFGLRLQHDLVLALDAHLLKPTRRSASSAVVRLQAE